MSHFSRRAVAVLTTTTYHEAYVFRDEADPKDCNRCAVECAVGGPGSVVPGDRRGGEPLPLKYNVLLCCGYSYLLTETDNTKQLASSSSLTLYIETTCQL